MSDGPGAGERRRVVTWSDPKALARAGRGLSGAEHLRAMMTGDLPPPPVMALLGITLRSVEEGLVRMQVRAAEYLYNPIGTVHGGILATILDSVMGCAVHSTLPLGRGYTTLEIKVNYLRAVTEAAGVVTAEGRAVHVGRTTGVADSRLFDEAGRLYATASTTCLVFDVPHAGSPT
jgi:uncharacterized protein (TIGR00369 family)